MISTTYSLEDFPGFTDIYEEITRKGVNIVAFRQGSVRLTYVLRALVERARVVGAAPPNGIDLTNEAPAIIDGKLQTVPQCGAAIQWWFLATSKYLVSVEERLLDWQDRVWRLETSSKIEVIFA